MLLSVASELRLDLSRSWMIGDMDADVLAGKAAGCRTILIDNPASRHKRAGSTDSDQVATDILAAAAIVAESSDCS